MFHIHIFCIMVPTGFMLSSNTGHYPLQLLLGDRLDINRDKLAEFSK